MKAKATPQSKQRARNRARERARAKLQIKLARLRRQLVDMSVVTWLDVRTVYRGVVRSGLT